MHLHKDGMLFNILYKMYLFCITKCQIVPSDRLIYAIHPRTAFGHSLKDASTARAATSFFLKKMFIIPQFFTFTLGWRDDKHII